MSRPLAFIIAVCIVTAPSSALAYTPQQQQACQADVLRLCGREIPDIERVKACMIQHRRDVSPACRAVLHR